jgi:thiol-disulfide isomerase/thioredoxin
MAVRVRAPELRGRGWLNTGGHNLTLKELRGRFLLLDFWTFCCINCLHVLDELRPLEEKYGDALVIIGVHSPKFEHEKDPAALAAAVERYGVGHPVLDDPELETWSQYTARAWPTLCLIDPEGYVVATMAGEGHAAALARMLDALIAEHTAKGTLHRGDGPFVPPPPPDTDLRYPGKAVALPDGGYLVTSSAQHQIVKLDQSLTVQGRIGSGERGRADGAFDQSQFAEPQGLCLLPPDVASAAGYDLVVADTVNHLLRGVRLSDGWTLTVAGTGRPWRRPASTVDALSLDLSSPWDLAWYQGRVIVAMAGIHQLWWFDPATGTAGVYAGTTVEALRDGPVAEAWFAQPSGLSTVDDHRLWVADSESSALRYVEDARVVTLVGQGLFDFGLADGPGIHALMQHPLGVCALPDGTVLVADTYNGAVRRFSDGQLTTVATDLAEPSDIVLGPDGAVLVVESGAHRLTQLAPGAVAAGEPGDRETEASRYRTQRPPTPLAPGTVTLEVTFTPPPGQKLDESLGPPTRLAVSASPPELLISGEGLSSELTRTLVLSDTVRSGVLQITAQAASCDADDEHAACHLSRQDWGVPVTIAADGPDALQLALLAREDETAGWRPPDR